MRIIVQYNSVFVQLQELLKHTLELKDIVHKYFVPCQSYGISK